jgi:hypothetical protein
MSVVQGYENGVPGVQSYNIVTVEYLSCKIGGKGRSISPFIAEWRGG